LSMHNRDGITPVSEKMKNLQVNLQKKNPSVKNEALGGRKKKKRLQERSGVELARKKGATPT